MAHGYIGDGYGIDGGADDRADERERSSRDRDWRERNQDWRDRDHHRDRGMMFGERDRDRERGWRDDDRWSDRGWREGSDRDRGHSFDRGEHSWSPDQSRNRGYSANPDDHYRSWRDRHMQELDRQYADYCREREQQFHRDFDSWLTQRHGNPGPLRTGMTQTGFSHEPEGELELTDPAKAGMAEEDPMDTATLGTNSAGGKLR
jgi:hypothetical protein